jgi:hypothetical protein
MRRPLWFVLVLCLFADAVARAGSITVSADTQDVTKGIPFQLVVEISGRDITRIEVPKIDGLTIPEEPNYSGTQVEFKNGRLTSTKTYGFLATPTRAGELVLPPFKAEVDGELIESTAITVKVLESPKPDDTSSRSVAGDQVLFTQIKCDKTEAYQGEAIALSMEVWIIEGANVRYEPTGFPELTGFYVLPREPREPTKRAALRDGRRYQVVTFSQTLFPAAPGELRVGPWTWRCSIGYRGQARNRETTTDPFTIRVKPLPDPPADFSGTVGQYQVAASLSSKSAVAGVPVTLTIGVVGNGNPDAIATPRLPSIDGIYADEPQRTPISPEPADTNGQNFTYKLTPQQPGDVTIPSIGYTFFDPASATYKTERSEPLTLHVTAPAKREAQVVVGAGKVETEAQSLGSDILALDTQIGSLQRQGDRTIPTAVVYVTPVFAYTAFALYLRRSRRFANDRAFARGYGALKNGMDRLARARQSGRTADGLYETITGFIADEFNLPEIGMTSAEAQLFFEAQRIPAEIADAFHKILKACERARYAGAELSADEVDALTQGAESAMQRLDEFRKRGSAA